MGLYSLLKTTFQVENKKKKYGRAELRRRDGLHRADQRPQLQDQEGLPA